MEKYWKEVSSTQKEKNITDNINQKQIIKFKERRMEIIFHGLRIGHVGLKLYLHRFNMATDKECNQCKEAESIEHYLLNCRKYDNKREIAKRELEKEDIKDITIKILLLRGNYNRRKNVKILDSRIKYIKAKKE